MTKPEQGATPRLDFEQRQRAILIAESRDIDLDTASELVYLRDQSQSAWNAAIAIAKDYGRNAGGRAFAITDRYGADAEEATLEEAAQVAAENIAKQLTEARDAALTEQPEAGQ